MDDVAINRLNELLLGAICTELEYTGGIPFIRFGSIGLWIPSAWRVVNNLRILAGGDSEDNVKNELVHTFIGQQVSEVYVHGGFHDLHLGFANGLILETFANAEAYESWNVIAGPDKMVIAGPGNSWSAF